MLIVWLLITVQSRHNLKQAKTGCCLQLINLICAFILNHFNDNVCHLGVSKLSAFVLSRKALCMMRLVNATNQKQV